MDAARHSNTPDQGKTVCVVGADFGTLDPRAAGVYDQSYAEYVLSHDSPGRGATEVMHRLRALRDRAIGRPVGAQP